MLSTASSAINSVITTLNSMATALTQAQNPGADIGNINTSLASLGKQLTDAVNGASFNGLNVLNGSLDHAELRLRLQRQLDRRDGQHHLLHRPGALRTGHRRRRRRRRPASPTSPIAATIAQLQTQWAADTADTTPVTAGTITATYGTAAIYEDTTNQAFTVQSTAL